MADPIQQAPTWMDAYNKFKQTDPNFMKMQQSNGYSDIDRRWNADDGTKQLKSALDQDYLRMLSEYNTANGTNLTANQDWLGVDAQPNDWDHTTHYNGGFLEHLGKSATESPIVRNLAVIAASIYGGPAGAAAANAAISRAQGNDWDQVAANGAGAYLGSSAVGQFAPGLSGGGTEGLMNTFGAGAGEGVGSGATTSAVTGGTEGVTGTSIGTLPTTTASELELANAADLAGGLGAGGYGAEATTAINAANGASATGLANTLGGSTLASTLSNGSNIVNLLKAGGSLYSAYKGQQNADKTNNAINDQITTLTDMYKEGSPWANQLKETLARKDAAAGRNSQYGPREAQFQALLADKAGQNAGVIAQLAQQAGTSNTNSNNYTNLLLNRLGDVSNATGLTKYLENNAGNAVKSAGDYISSAWDSYFG